VLGLQYRLSLPIYILLALSEPPQGLGFDERGRHVLEFVPGAMWDRKHQNTLAALSLAFIPTLGNQ
jgi:hypothetical protein